ncbi:rod shape-determining protein MreD [Aerosakkonema funiforme]|uniref:Rod shape-determining protein MreD n=1 Tax=Aerosakkonema funiforme FACHB-1375 TaxID=2949571 RepID=A0A926VIV1_9CYAN|nr:rod shape-determining protein MreD [Aerosakkonema funiforme]MBD2184654.1 rod shape-determining protein MreD [Aerosakkonema funiforme FACHB-1375]
MTSYRSSSQKYHRWLDISKWHPTNRKVINALVTLGSVLLCLLFLLARLPGMELLGFGPDWLLIWVVAWSVKRSPISGAIAGVCLGLIQDGMTAPYPSHAISLACAGILTACLKKQRYVEEDFISVALIVFGMAILLETVFALQFTTMSDRNMAEVWTEHQRIALASAILSSLWAPVLYYPLNRWWKKVNWQES